MWEVTINIVKTNKEQTVDLCVLTLYYILAICFLLCYNAGKSQRKVFCNGRKTIACGT